MGFKRGTAEKQVELDNESGQIVNRYIKGDERSFTIIAYPVPEIGDDFPEIFAEIVKINTLDYKQYQGYSRRSLILWIPVSGWKSKEKVRMRQICSFIFMN